MPVDARGFQLVPDITPIAQGLGSILRRPEERRQEKKQHQAQQREVLGAAARGFSTASDKKTYLQGLKNTLEQNGFNDLALEVENDILQYDKDPQVIENEYAAALNAFGSPGQGNSFGATLTEAVDGEGNRVFVQPGRDGNVRIHDQIKPVNKTREKIELETGLQTQTPQGQLATEKLEEDAKLSKIKADQAAKKNKKSTDMLLAQADFIDDQIELAKSQASKAFDGRVGEIAAAFSPTGESANLRRTLDTIKANVGFGELLRMKQSSPTGGALGSVSERELTLLTATLGNLDAIQSDDELNRVLDQVKSVFDRIRTETGEGSPEGSVDDEISALEKELGL